MKNEELKEKITSLKNANESLEQGIQVAKEAMKANSERINQLQKQLSVEKFLDLLRIMLMECSLTPTSIDIIVKENNKQVVYHATPKRNL